MIDTTLNRSQPRQVSSRDALENLGCLEPALFFGSLLSLGFGISKKIAFVAPSPPVASRKVDLSVFQNEQDILKYGFRQRIENKTKKKEERDENRPK